MNATARITATGLATLIMALGLGAGVAAAQGHPQAGASFAVPCELTNPEPDGPDPKDGPTDLAQPLPTPHPDPDPAGPTEVAPVADPEVNPDLQGGLPDLAGEQLPIDPPVGPELPIDGHVSWPAEDCGGPHGGGDGQPTPEPGGDPTGQNEPADPGDGADPGAGSGDDPGSGDGTDGTHGPAGGSAHQPPAAGDDTLASTGFGAGLLTAAVVTLIGAGAFALLLARMVHQRTRRL